MLVRIILIGPLEPLKMGVDNASPSERRWLECVRGRCIYCLEIELVYCDSLDAPAGSPSSLRNEADNIGRHLAAMFVSYRASVTRSRLQFPG